MIEVGRSGSISKIGVIKLPAFYIDFEARARGDRHYRSTTRDVRQLIGELVRDGAQGIVIDLRGNGGGSLLEANELTGLFIQEGPVVQVRGCRWRSRYQRRQRSGDRVRRVRSAVLGTAECVGVGDLRGAIQDYRRGSSSANRPSKGHRAKLIDLDSLGRWRAAGTSARSRATVAQFFRSRRQHQHEA